MNEVLSKMSSKDKGVLLEQAMEVLNRSSRPIDYVFILSNKREKVLFDLLVEDLPFYTTRKIKFFTTVEPWYSIAKQYKVKNREGYVYFFKNEDDGLVKIGRAKNITSRYNSLKISIQNLTVLNSIFVSDAPKAESILHSFFKDKNVYREWYLLSESDVEKGIEFLSKGGQHG